MNKLLIILLLAVTTTIANAQSHSHNHTEEEPTESEMVLQMFETDNRQDLEKATLYYNSILSTEVQQDKKCGYATEMEKTLFRLDLGLKQYIGILSRKVNSSMLNQFEGDPSTISIKLMLAYELESRANTLASVLPILRKNNNCE